MPELAELKIMAEFVNKSATSRTFNKVNKSKVSKNSIDHIKIGLKHLKKEHNKTDFKIHAGSRGKEMSIFLSAENPSSPIFSAHAATCITMGMTGNWEMCPEGEEPKHMHLMFHSTDGMILGLVDPRRFAKWRQGDFDLTKSPDPVTDHAPFLKNIENNIHKSAFKSPICEVLLDQKYFNGIGNYLRAEILHRAKQDPMERADIALAKNKKILQLCETIPLEAYKLGGGELFTWKNPNGENRDKFKNWLQCYGKLNSFKDSNSRTMWTAFEVENVKKR